MVERLGGVDAAGLMLKNVEVLAPGAKELRTENGTQSGEVEGNDDFIRNLADTLSGVAAAV